MIPEAWGYLKHEGPHLQSRHQRLEAAQRIAAQRQGYPTATMPPRQRREVPIQADEPHSCGIKVSCKGFGPASAFGAGAATNLQYEDLAGS